MALAAAEVVFGIAVLGPAYAAAQVAPDGWPKTVASTLIIVAGIIALVDNHALRGRRRARLVIIGVAALGALASVPIALGAFSVGPKPSETNPRNLTIDPDLNGKPVTEIAEMCGHVYPPQPDEDVWVLVQPPGKTSSSRRFRAIYSEVLNGNALALQSVTLELRTDGSSLLRR
jgi:hypothetical protein